MEAKKDHVGMLDLMIRPAFYVKENKILQSNSAAEALLLLPGSDVRPLLQTGQEEYAAFSGGCLYLKLALSSCGCGATVTKWDNGDVFVLDLETDDGELRALSLAARELREPLSSLMICTDRLSLADTAEAREQSARLSRSLHQMLRIIGNMSDAGSMAVSSRQELRDIGSVFNEVMEKAQTLLSHTGIHMTWKPLTEEVLCLADAEQLERAVLNILSNAVKFTPTGGVIDAQLTRCGKMLRLTICDSGSGIADAVRSSVFRRYLRQPGIEDSRFGLGLGMVLIRSAASNHGGAVLIDQPEGKGTRITMTLAIRQATEPMLRSPVLRVDYAGERNHGLVELADCLPVHVYEKEK